MSLIDPENQDPLSRQLRDSMSHWSRRLDRTYGDAQTWQAEISRVTTIISEFSQPGRLLDLACGDGLWTSLLTQRASVIAFDYSNSLLTENRRRTQQKGNKPLPCVRGDVFSLPFRNDSFDRCFCGFWLSMVPPNLVNPFLAELSRVVRAGGHVLFVDTFFSPEESMQKTPSIRTPASLRAAIWPFAEDVEIFRTSKFFLITNYVVRTQR